VAGHEGDLPRDHPELGAARSGLDDLGRGPREDLLKGAAEVEIDLAASALLEDQEVLPQIPVETLLG